MIYHQNHACRLKPIPWNLTVSRKPNHMMANFNETQAKEIQHQEIIKKIKLAEIQLPSGPKITQYKPKDPPSQITRTTSDPTGEDRRQLLMKIFFCIILTNVCNLTRILHTDQIAFSLKT